MVVHEQMREPAAASKARERGLSVLERQAEAECIAAAKDAARRPRAKRSKSVPRGSGSRDKNGGDEARGRGAVVARLNRD